MADSLTNCDNSFLVAQQGLFSPCVPSPEIGDRTTDTLSVPDANSTQMEDKNTSKSFYFVENKSVRLKTVGNVEKNYRPHQKKE